MQPNFGPHCADCVTTACVYSGRVSQVECEVTVLVTERQRNTTLYDQLQSRGLKTLELICAAATPGLIADAVFDGRRAARIAQQQASTGNEAVHGGLTEDLPSNAAREYYIHARGEREGKDDMHCTAQSVYFTNSGTAVTTFDAQTKSYRPSTLCDIYDFTRPPGQLRGLAVHH
ncbi:hypothetical protein [Ruegeria arenilitoris]|uniref:hypothetical protein n=1 Tax=Ruegeria arenilitoris TaxID=1173585 RepID=UPI0020C1D9FB|nr:hypothetical protein [Ruegeria arenilitoris]